jgi:hypothetical protein
MPTTDRAVNLYEKDQAICAPWSISTLEGVDRVRIGRFVSGDFVLRYSLQSRDTPGRTYGLIQLQTVL